MSKWRLVMLSVIILILQSGAFAQRRNSVPRADRCWGEAPLTLLEEFDSRMQTVIVRGSTRVSTLPERSNLGIGVDALEVRDESNGSRAMGVVITLREANREDPAKAPDESRSYIDYEEIDRVVHAWDQVARTDDTITKLNNFESRYRTKGDIEIVVFRQVPGGAVAASISGGLCEPVRVLLSLDDFIKVRHMVVEAKKRLDEIR